MNRQKLLLAILLLLFLAAAVTAYLRWPRQQSVTAPRSPAPAAPRAAAPSVLPSVAPAAVPPTSPAATPGTIADSRFVRLDLLQRERSRFKGFRRNIFRPLYQEAPAGARPPLKELKPPPPPAVIPTVAPPVVPAQPEVQRDMARFTFLGYLRRDGVQTVFLSKDGKIVLVKKGDRIEGKYDATGMTQGSLTIRVLSDGTEMVIPLEENKPLATKR